MGEKPITELCQKMKESLIIPHDIPQTVYAVKGKQAIPPSISQKEDIVLHSHESCLSDKKKEARISDTSKRNQTNTKQRVSFNMPATVR